MKSKNNILRSQLIAGFLLVMFCFVHVVKTAHRHEPLKSIAKTSQNNKIFGAPACAICDYELVKAFDQSVHYGLAPALPQLSPGYSDYNAPLVTSIGATSSGRGPPSIS
ncbi:hypothetical protein EXU57_23335 [Segetibacter sp. 3557_3]|uniref:hypothetical protein n=1 Tax=Segetibacter sp. 3557_3 TaxID=2547429 RepID=UPI001058E1D5|nr:hypothetical protein [Segetibacter sp. 3557_3]TDH18400.1 hypothetical protein EXU57_23335 [Segetibacter sp. 3557_3]